MRIDRTLRVIAPAVMLAAAGCASSPAPVAASRPACTAPATRPEFCTLPADVRAFVEDRDLCEHFLGEPWPEGDSPEERQRRRELVDGVRVNCAGTDRRLAELRQRHANEEGVMAALAGYEARIEE